MIVIVPCDTLKLLHNTANKKRDDTMLETSTRVFSVINEYFYAGYSRKTGDMYKKSGKTFDCYCYRPKSTETLIQETFRSAEASEENIHPIAGKP